MTGIAVGELIALVALWTALARHVHPWLLVPMACVTLISLQPIIMVLLDVPAPDPGRHLAAAFLVTAFAAFAVVRKSRVALLLLAVWAGLTTSALARPGLHDTPEPYLTMIRLATVLRLAIVAAVVRIVGKRSDLLDRAAPGETGS